MESQSSLGCSAAACVALEWVSVLSGSQSRVHAGSRVSHPSTAWSWFVQIPPKSMERFLFVRKNVH